MARSTSKKCASCAQQSVDQAKEKDCWNPSVCHARRTYYRHRQQYVEQRWQRRQAQTHSQPAALPKTEELELAVELPNYAIAVLVYYRKNASSDVHAVAAELWQSGQLVTRVKPIHCLGLTAGQVKQHLRRILQALSEQYHLELEAYGSVVELDPSTCPLRPCPLHPHA